MADERDKKVQEALQNANIGEDIPNFPSEFRDAAAENDQPVTTESTTNWENADSIIGASVPMKSSAYKEEMSPEIGDTVPIKSAYQEETAAEIAAPVPVVRGRERDDERETTAGGTGMGTLALALSILSLFVMPILFGAAGIVLGFVARSRGATGLGAWAIGIGAMSIIVGIFILPFF
jgi:hypothetical protein